MAFFLGALIATLILSRLLWLVARRWPNSIGKAATLDLGAGVIGGLLAAIGGADGGAPQIVAAVYYIAAGGLLIGFDALRIRRKAQN